jgi:ABC-type lipoprotein release transport system permease subunit
MIFQIAWRNIWRNRTRSLVIIASVSLGLWAGIFIMALSFGMTEERKDKLINEQLSHIQLHTPAFTDNQELAEYIPAGPGRLDTIREWPGVQHASGRTLINGMVSAAEGSGGVRIIGVYPELEDQLTRLQNKVVEGEYFPDKNNRILIGRALADKLGVKLGSKVVLTFQDTSTNMVAAAFRVGGLYKTVSAKLDETLVYVKVDDLARLLDSEPLLHEIALLAEQDNAVTTLHDELAAAFPQLQVETWRELSPELRYLDEMMDLFLYIFIGIILFALAFGLVNTMLMAVLERTRELGMMMAVGLNKRKLFSMILLETLFLALTGMVVGFVLGFLTVRLTARTGISLAVVQQGMEEFGMSAVLYPELAWRYYPIIALMVVAFAVLSAIYPALKALQLNPTQAIRKV